MPGGPVTPRSTRAGLPEWLRHHREMAPIGADFNPFGAVFARLRPVRPPPPGEDRF